MLKHLSLVVPLLAWSGFCAAAAEPRSGAARLAVAVRKDVARADDHKDVERRDDRPDIGLPSSRDAGPKPRLEVTRDAAGAIRKAVSFLSKRQDKDGSFSVRGGRHRAAITGLAGMAFLSAGHVPGRSRHGRVVERAARYLLKIQDKEGCFASPGGRTMHGHGYALHFMAEAYGMTRDPGLARKLRESVKAGVRLTCRTQSTSGGWWYQPVAGSQHEGSITVTQVQAIWAARQAGITVPQKTIDKAIGYMRKSQMGDGGIAYALNRKKLGSRPAISVAGVMVFCGLGKRESREARRAVGYMRRMLAGRARARNGKVHPYNRLDPYTTMYMAQALYQAGEPEWSAHYPGLRDTIIKAQKEDGSWTSGRGQVYGTACQVLALAVPYQYLPSFQR